MPTRLWPIIVMGLSGVGVMATQSPNVAAKSSPVFLMLPRAGAPMSFDQVEERSQRDGSDTEVISSKVVRDTAGRVRIEALPHPVIIDPVAGFQTVLVPESKVAIRVPFSKGEGEARFVFFGGFVDRPAGPPNSAGTVENVGKLWLEGVEFEGTRIVWTYETVPQTTETQEDWFSEDLKLMGLIVASGPTETYKAYIRNLRREEPDPALFSIPSGYQMLELALPHNP
jgi:hypothetical protein